MVYQIRYYGDPVLRKRAQPVTEFDDALKKLSQDMLETMYDASGVGLAAPQIGILKRIFVGLEMAPKVAQEESSPAQRLLEAPTEMGEEDEEEPWDVVAEHVIINPEIIAMRGDQLVKDGCLSLPGIMAEDVRRDLEVTMRYQDLRGETQEITAQGYFAHVLQHEYDHLNGVLYLDRMNERVRKQFMETHRKAFAQFQRDAKTYLKTLKGA